MCVCHRLKNSDDDDIQTEIPTLSIIGGFDQVIDYYFIIGLRFSGTHTSELNRTTIEGSPDSICNIRVLDVRHGNPQ